MEVLYNIEPDYKTLRIFGCLVFVHIPKDKRSTLETSRKKGIFVGHSETSKACRIYIYEEWKIEVSKDVTFDREVAFRKSHDLDGKI